MRFRTVLSLATLFIFLFTVAAWSSPLLSQPTVSLWTPTTENPSVNQSVAGKITAVSDAEFSVDVSKNQKPGAMRFLVDRNTKVEGKLAVGAEATVEYRSEDGKNIAVRVVVTPPSEMTPH